MHQVNLYVYSTIRGSRESEGIVGYMLEAPELDPTGSHNRSGFQKVKMQRLKSILYGIKCGLARMKGAVNLHIFVDDDRLYQAFSTNSLSKWSQNGWITAKGTPVKYREEYEEVLHYLTKEAHTFRVTCDREYRKDADSDGFYEWMKQEAERRLNEGA